MTTTDSRVCNGADPPVIEEHAIGESVHEPRPKHSSSLHQGSARNVSQHQSHEDADGSCGKPVSVANPENDRANDDGVLRTKAGLNGPHEHIAIYELFGEGIDCGEKNRPRRHGPQLRDRLAFVADKDPRTESAANCKDRGNVGPPEPAIVVARPDRLDGGSKIPDAEVKTIAPAETPNDDGGHDDKRHQREEQHASDEAVA